MTLMVRIALVLHVLLALGLAFVPLFDGLGFERSLATGLLTAVTSPLVTISLVRRGRKVPASFATIGQRALITNLMLLLPTVAAGAIVEVIRQPCEPDAGLVFILLVAGGNAVFGTALGSLASLFTLRGWAPYVVVSGVLVAALVGVVLRFYVHPQIFIYSAPWGFWPGSLYDEALAVDARLWAFRGYSSLAAATLFSLAYAFCDLSLHPTWKPRIGALVATATFGVATLWAADQGRQIGWNLDREAVQAVLRARVETEHFIIHIDPSVPIERLERIAEDHEHRYAQLKVFFEAEPNGKVNSFVYRDRNQKAELIGARGTQIARPWNREIHIDGFSVPHRILKHELAHVFGSAKARGPFKVPAFAGLFVNIGVVEGIAVAADWPVRELTVHGWTKAMQGLGLMPDLRKSLDVLGFWSINSARAYTVAGSFLRYLVDTYGIDKFWRLYASNSFDRAYDRPLDELVTEWEAFLTTIPLPKDDLLIAEHRFKRPSIFQKVCAHVSANLKSRGYGRLGRGDLEGAREDLEQIYAYAPADPTPLVALAEAYGRIGRYTDADALVARAFAAPGATLKGQTRVLEVQGDLAWRKDDAGAAAAAYRTVLTRHLSTPSDRLQQARILALTRTSTDAEMQAVLTAVLLGDDPPLRKLARLAETSARHPRAALLNYLYARALEQAGAYTEGVRAAERAVAGDLGDDPLRTEAILTLGRLLWWADRSTEAEALFEKVARTHPSPAVRAMAADWADRARFSVRFRRDQSPTE